MQEIYLDNSATTALCPQAITAMETVMHRVHGNPSSMHAAGCAAEQIVRQARAQVMRALGVQERGAALVFCASGTEADNLALTGVAHAKEKFRGSRIVLSDSEHPAIEKTVQALEAEGFEVIRIPTRGGVIDPDNLLQAVNERTLLLSIMTVNNETGAVYDVGGLFRAAKAKNPALITHTDAVQAFLKIPFNPQRMCADLATVSAHKIHGPKGIGGLYIAPQILKAKNIAPVIYGGGQESGLRSGTENTVGIAGFGAACEAGFATLAEDVRTMRTLRDHLIKVLSPEIQVKRPVKEWAPHIVNITLPHIKSETMLNHLSAQGIYVSAGSACSSHGKADNRVLTAFGASTQEADCSLRISLCAHNTKEEIDRTAQALSDGIRRLVRIDS